MSRTFVNTHQSYRLIGNAKDSDGNDAMDPLGHPLLLVEIMGGERDGEKKTIDSSFMPPFREYEESFLAWMRADAGVGDMPDIRIEIEIRVTPEAP